LNRGALPAPDPNASQPARTIRPPRNRSEEKLVEICAEVLHLELLSVDEDLFQLGADSIQMFQIVARANRAGIPLTVQQLLRYPTVEGVANLEQTEKKQDLEPIKRLSRERHRVEKASLPS